MQGMEDAADQYDLSAAYEHPDHPKRQKTSEALVQRREKNAPSPNKPRQAKIDAILIKVKDKPPSSPGLKSAPSAKH